MKVVLAGVGSRGDFQPLLALGLALKARGHAVVMYGASNFAAWTAREGLDFAGSQLDVDELLRSGAHALSKPLQTFRRANQVMRDELECQFPTLVRLAESADLVLGMGFCMAGRSAAELAGIPFHLVLYTPQLLPSAAHPPFQIPFQGLAGWLNRAAHRVAAFAMNLAFGRRLNILRQQVGLPARDDLFDLFVGDEVLLACDPQIAPVPADSPIASVELAAFCYEQPPTLPEAIEHFIAHDQPPLYVDFGSMVDPAPETTRRMLERIAHALDIRILLHQRSTPAVSGPPTQRVHVAAGALPHHALLPRMAAVVHHGGAGTTAAVARAGVPQLVVPHLFDQFHFAERLRRLGVTPTPIPRRRLTEHKLQTALADVLRDASFTHAARALQSSLSAVNGVTLAADLIEARYGAETIGAGFDTTALASGSAEPTV